ncbi:PREDICTED: uncharacterized protein LOC105561673 isoform X2 [Vollenhovia emeryi]|uniref:uncharacterized protein LOC105561673 isoform X2 n=1 Tax=Vollenhovia emeryi TaxID=411798 RepID=UPI0005F543DE|nr:PREDICTED: uncharacterized protein LOC105561673 isoform X2 [Vollenhovia emeryi]
MRPEYIFICNLTCLLFFLLAERLFASGESGSDYSKGCAHLRCENGSRCVKRRFWCKDPPCPGMLYCSRSRKESLKGPLTCNTVRCSKGHVCVVKVRGCHWDEKCKQQLARCVTEKEYHEGAASCAGFECPSGERCILRETLCDNPPCKLIRSCESAEDVQLWFDVCQSLSCPSEHECFLRRPENNCHDPWWLCTHTPDCTLTVEDELVSKYCYGWVCPRGQKCAVRIVDSCKGFNCTIERSCRASLVSSATRNNKLILPVTQKENIRHTTPTEHGIEVSLTRQQIATTKSNLIAESLESSPNEPYVTLPYPTPRLNYNKPTVLDESKIVQSSTSLATSPADGKTEPTMSRDTERLEESRKIYIAADDTLSLPTMLEDINFLGQGYPIWIKNDPYRSLEAKDGNGWRYHAPQEPHKILLPPYEPAILVEGVGRRGQFLPFFTDAFDHLFNEAALISSPDVTPADIGGSKTDSTSTIADEKTVNYTNGSTGVEIENVKTNHSNDSSGDHANFPATEKTNAAPPSDKELGNYYDNHEWRPWYVIHDYLERNDQPQPSRGQGSESSIVDLATDDFYRNDTLADVESSTRTTDEKRSRVSETRYVDGRNKNLATLSPPVSTGQSDYSARNEKLHGLANYLYDTISVHHVGKSSREHGGSSAKQIFDVSSDGEGNQVPRKRRLDVFYLVLDGLRNRFRISVSARYSDHVSFRPITWPEPGERPVMFSYEASPHYTRNNNMRSNDRVVYDEYSSHESYDNIGGTEMTGS